MGVKHLGTGTILLCALALHSRAGTIPVSIQGDIQFNSYRFVILGEEFEYRVSTPEGPLAIGLCGETPCSVTQEYSGGNFSARFGEFVRWQGITAPEAAGSIVARFAILSHIAVPPGAVFTAPARVSLQGDIAALTSFPELDELFHFGFTGTGEGTITGRVFPDEVVFQTAQFNVPGVVEAAIPEPAALLLTAPALALAALIRRGIRRP